MMLVDWLFGVVSELQFQCEAVVLRTQDAKGSEESGSLR